MNKKQETLLWQYQRATKGLSIHQVYGSPSQAKINAYYNCNATRYALGGYKWAITSATCNFFSYAFLHDVVDTTTGEVRVYLYYDTGRNVYDFDVTERVSV